MKLHVSLLVRRQWPHVMNCNFFLKNLWSLKLIHVELYAQYGGKSLTSQKKKHLPYLGNIFWIYLRYNFSIKIWSTEWNKTFCFPSNFFGSFICLLSVFLQDKKELQFSQYFGLTELLDILNSILYISRILNFKKNLKGKGWELSFYLWIFTLFKDLSHHDISFLLSGFAPLRWRRHGKTFLQESLK